MSKTCVKKVKKTHYGSGLIGEKNISTLTPVSKSPILIK